MKPSFPLIRGAGILLLLAFPLLASATSDELEFPTVEPQSDGPIQLPVWQPGESREGFDIRIWPDTVVFWLERENLRDLIADPELPEEERRNLQRILDQQESGLDDLAGGS